MDKLTWALIGVMACADVTLSAVYGITVDYVPILPFLCLALWAVFTRLWPIPYIASIAMAVAQFELVLVATGVFNYLSIALGFRPIDAELEAIDRVLGIDWPALWSLVVERPRLRAILGVFYSSLAIQVAILVFAMTVTSRFDRVRELLALTSITVVICVLIAAVLPRMAHGDTTGSAEKRTDTFRS
jgi:hypothetical protein